MAEAMHVLPLAGGLFDQPAGYIIRMEAVMRATNDHDDVLSKNKAEAEARLHKRVEEEREWHSADAN